MKYIISLFFFLVLISLQSCGENVISEPLDLTTEQSPKHRHVYGGVWLSPPRFYKKAKTFAGFRAGTQSTISVSRSYKAFSKLVASYNEDNLKRKQLIPLEIRSIKLNNDYEGLFVAVEDKRKRIIKYKLLLNYEGEVLQVESYYLTGLEKKYKEILRDAIFSIYLGDEVIQMETFQMAMIDTEFNTIIYTSDGKYPTESDDGLTLREIPVKNINAKTPERFVEDKIMKELGEIPDGDRTDFFTGGKVKSKMGKVNGKSAIVSLYYDQSNNNGFMISCTGNEKMDLDKVFEDIKNKYLKLTLE